MILFRNIYKKRLKKTDSTINPKEQLIGKTGKTVEPTDAHGGKILVGDVYWRAVTGGEKIEKDKTAVITDVKGTSLIIKSEEEKGE